MQLLLIRRFGGCGVLPCWTYHLGHPTNVANRTSNATDLFAAWLRDTGTGTVPPDPVRNRPSRPARHAAMSAQGGPTP